MRTGCKAEMKFTDVSALEDATPSSSENKSFGQLSNLQAERKVPEYGTLELNQFVLDGSRQIVESNPENVAFWSTDMSGADCSFATAPTLTVVFEKAHSSSGLTLYFGMDYPEEVEIEWYTLGGTKLLSEVFYPDALVFTCNCPVQNYGKVIIKITKTRYPQCYARLQYILYGLYIAWQDDLIQTGKVTEEVDFTSASLSINEAELEIVDVNNDFDIGNENGAWKSVQKTQQITLTEIKDGKEIPAGTFHIDDFSFKKNIVNFKMIDKIGLMDKYTYYDGEIYKARKAGIILESIFASAGITKYSIEEEVYNTLLDGYLEIQTCREALQMVCFACGALASDSRSDSVKVYKPDRYVKYTVGPDRKFNGNTSVSLDCYVSGVSIERSVYTLEDKDSEIYNDYLPKGLNRITFSEPYQIASITVTGGTAKTVRTNYIEVQMSKAGTCTITGKKYADAKVAYQENVTHLEAGESESVKSFGTITLYNLKNLPDIAKRLLDYYSLRKKIDMKFLLDLEEVGNWINVTDTSGNTSTTLIESQTIDLTGGFIATASCRGYSVVVTENYYAGTELYAGGGGII